MKYFANHILEGNIEECFRNGEGGIYLGNNENGNSDSGDSSYCSEGMGHRSIFSRQQVSLTKQKLLSHWQKLGLGANLSYLEREMIQTFDEFCKGKYLSEKYVYWRVGMLNDKNSCYSNVSIQLLNNIPTFKEIISK